MIYLLCRQKDIEGKKEIFREKRLLCILYKDKKFDKNILTNRIQYITLSPELKVPSDV